MAKKHPEAKSTRRKYPGRLVQDARALGVDPEWLRTGKGCVVPRVESETPEAEATAIYRALESTDRENWIAFGRILAQFAEERLSGMSIAEANHG